jgi:hypothetical protein
MLFSEYNEQFHSMLFYILARCNVVCCANYIKENLGCISIKQDDRLMEMNFGDWEMKTGMLLILMSNPWMADFVTIRVLMENHLPIYTVVLSILYKVNSTIRIRNQWLL